MVLLYNGFLWLIASCISVLSQTEIPARVVTLLDENAYVNYKPVVWNYTDDDSQLILPIRFRTRSIRGRLITLSAQGAKNTNIFTLYAFIDNSAVVVSLTDDNGELIKKTERQLPGANSGVEHSMSIQLNPQTKILKMVYGQGTIDSYDFSAAIRVEQNMQLNIRTGSYGGDLSVIGCVAIVGLTIGSHFVFELEEATRFGAIRDGCDTLCLDRQCNKGNCVDLFHSAICDCRGTYQTGEKCDEEMKTLNVSWYQYISYKISENESQPSVISIDFKTEVKEGLIIHGTILSLENNELLGNLKLALIYGQLRLKVATLAEINFDNVILSSENFNQILLEFDYGLDLIHMTFNGNTKSASLNKGEKENHIRFGSELFFSAGDSEVGLSGCLRAIYVGYFDVIDGYVKSSPKVNANAELKSCDGKDLLPAKIQTINLPPFVDEADVETKMSEEASEKLQKQEPKNKTETEHDLVHDIESHLGSYQDEKYKNDGIHDQEDERDKQIKQEQERLKAEEDVQAAIDDAVSTNIIAESPLKQFCENDEATSCKNSVECVKEGAKAVCVCRKGFTGEYCQFSLLPWNCDEVFREGNTVPGTYIIDTDGSGPLPESYVYCENGHTIITHNMPNKTLIHNKDLGDIQMIVNYKLFNDELLQSLKNRSEMCKQAVRYDCRAAPLQFDALKTWFTSIGDNISVGFGGNDGTCPCTDGKCKKCNCDSGGIAVDYGVMQGAEAPIRKIYSLNDPADSQGYLTLGPLICSGSVGFSTAYTMVIRKQLVPEKIGIWKGDSFSFEFRTYLENATLLTSSDGKLELTMAERTIYLRFDNQINLALTPQSRKSDGYWHRIVVDIRDGFIRFSVDETVATAKIDQHSFSELQLNIGGGRDGFLGCVRQIIIDGVLKEVDERLQNDCINKCEAHNCKHASRCVHDFANDSLRCVCKNDIVYFGDFCQNSINYGSEISFHDTKRAFLKAQNPAVANALMERIVFSFRTDQRDALLIYLHDQLYNFVQVHLYDHSHMVLTLNFNRTIHRCEVVAKVGNEFSRMKWIQVMIFQWPDRAELNVDDEICQINAQRTLSTTFIKKFDIAADIDDVVEPPVSPLALEDEGKSHPYVLLFVAGVPTENYFGSLDPIYRSSIPNLLGCMRGLMLGADVLDMHDKNYWTNYPIENDMIRFGCKTGCHKIDQLCKNGGHCAVRWTAKFVEEDASCNCARTSYYGEYCDQDSGAHFAANSLLIFNANEIFEKVIVDWSQTVEHSFSFAFSAANSANAIKPQALAIIYFEHKRMMEIVLCKNGSLNVAVMSNDASFVYSFPSKYDDGYRHYFQSTFRHNKPLKVTVDSWKFIFPADLSSQLSLTYVSKFVFGGTASAGDLKGSGDRKAKKNNYTGCISNIDINMNIARMHFKPILYLQKPELEFAQSVTVLGDQLELTACNSFLTPGNLPPILDIVTSPVWDSPFTVEPYVRTNDESAPETEIEGLNWWLILLIALLLLVVIFIIFIIFYCLQSKKQPPTPQPVNRDHAGIPDCHEHSPLISDEKKEPSFMIKDEFVLPEPDQYLDQIQTNDNGHVVDIQPALSAHPVSSEVVTGQPSRDSRVSIISGMSGLTAYFTANTTFDSDDEDLARAPQAFDDDYGLEGTLIDYDEDSTLIPSREDMRNFDRIAPERISSFKSGPTNLSLYKPAVARKPKPVPPHRSPVI